MLEAKSTLSKLVEKVESGAEKEIIIARNGKPAARLVPLLDAQIAIWAVIDQARLSAKARGQLTDSSNELVVSAVSVWEIAIKYPLLKRRDAPPFSGRLAQEAFMRIGFDLIHITSDHAAQVEQIPLLHGDPFDRLLLAQATWESMPLLSADAALARYGEIVIPA